MDLWFWAVVASVVACLAVVVSWLLRRKAPIHINAQRKFVQPPDQGARLHGTLLNVAAVVMESCPVLRNLSKKTLGMGRLKEFLVEEVPTFIPRHFPETDTSAPAVDTLVESVIDTQNALESSAKGFHYNTVADYHSAFLSGRCTPTDVAKRLIEAVEHSNQVHNLRAIIDCNAEDVLSQAEASTERYRAGTPLGFLDGVPISAKDQINVESYSTFKGMRPSPQDNSVASSDATAVGRLRAAGAVIFGKANQTEIGIHVTGLNCNQRYGHCRNPYNPLHHTGGSSSGSGAAVAAGLGPISVAADGGGSIRLPAGMCGQVGIKPTCGRVSLFGDTACFGSTVDVVGPIGATPFDAAIALAVMSGRDTKDPTTLHAPSARLGRFEHSASQLGFDGMRIGVDRSWFSRATDEMTSRCEAALSEFTNRGASLVDITVPDLDLITEAHSMTISSEMFTDVHEHAIYNPSFFQSSTRLLLAYVLRSLTSPFALTLSNRTAGDTSAHEYLQAAKLRTRMINHLLKAFADCDFIATPNTGVAPPAIPTDLGLNGDESDVGKQLAIMRFMQVANFTGLPATCFPVGYTDRNVPIALQLIGKPWAEGDLLHTAALSSTIFSRNRPEVYYDLLS